MTEELELRKTESCGYSSWLKSSARNCRLFDSVRQRFLPTTSPSCSSRARGKSGDWHCRGVRASVLLNSSARKQTAGSEKSRAISIHPSWVRRAAFCESEGRPLWAPLMPTVQKINFKATCPMRGGRALVTTPKVPLRKLPVGFPGVPNWAWLKVLKNSNRNWSILDSVRVMFL
jgi:hypothetical protein